jgi:polysaccharide pyruvyl transferase CsaB
VSKRILIAGYMGSGNIGDEAIAEVMTGHLRDAVAGCDISIVSANPAQTAQAYGVRAVQWNDPVAISEAVRTADLTIIGGGGLFQDYWGFDPDAVMTRQHWGLSSYTAPALLSAAYGKPVMLYAVGVGPLLSDHGRRYTKAAADVAARITVRDPASKAQLESIGVPAGKIRVTADPVFDIVPAANPDAPEISEWTSRRPGIAVCLRHWNIGVYQPFYERQIAAALDDILANEGGRVLFLPFQQGAGMDDDSAVARRVIAEMRHKGDAAVLTAACSPAETAGIIANADLVLGMRLHSIIFSLIAGIPFVALEYDPKVGALAAVTGLEGFTIPFGGMETDLLAERMRRALASREIVCRTVAGLLPELRSAARENAVIAAELLHSEWHPPAYDPDTHALLGRIMTAQIVANERNLVQLDAEWRNSERMQGQQAELTGELSTLKANLERLESQNADLTEMVRIEQETVNRAREFAREVGEIKAEMVLAHQRLEAAEQRVTQLQSELDAALVAKRILEDTIAAGTAKRPGAIARRGLHVALDAVEICVPARLRAAVRKYYLNWFYYRIYPEKRVAGAPVVAASVSRETRPASS